jgi:hypothetical protein
MENDTGYEAIKSAFWDNVPEKLQEALAMTPKDDLAKDLGRTVQEIEDIIENGGDFSYGDMKKLAEMMGVPWSEFCMFMLKGYSLRSKQSSESS